MSKSQSALQYHEMCWLNYQERIVSAIFNHEPVNEAHLDCQDHHQEEYLKLQCTEILQELSINTYSPDS